MFYIRSIGDPALRVECEPVTEETFFRSSVWSIFDEMALLLIQCRGVGLAANQVGVLRRFFIYDYKDKIDIIINPEIVAKSPKTTIATEGCLSIPDGLYKVERPRWVVLQGENYYGQKIELRAKGFFARVIQHEMDHLDGKMICDVGELVLD
jgi:peptide deformylase